MSVRFLTLEIVLEVVVRHGWQVKDAGLLDSALQRPRATVFGQDAYPALDLKAAALLHSVAQNQALVDGNKPLALLCTHAFVTINGAAIGAEDDDVHRLLDRLLLPLLRGGRMRPVHARPVRLPRGSDYGRRGSAHVRVCGRVCCSRCVRWHRRRSGGSRRGGPCRGRPAVSRGLGAVHGG